MHLCLGESLSFVQSCPVQKPMRPIHGRKFKCTFASVCQSSCSAIHFTQGLQLVALFYLCILQRQRCLGVYSSLLSCRLRLASGQKSVMHMHRRARRPLLTQPKCNLQLRRPVSSWTDSRLTLLRPKGICWLLKGASHYFAYHSSHWGVTVALFVAHCSATQCQQDTGSQDPVLPVSCLHNPWLLGSSSICLRRTTCPNSEPHWHVKVQKLEHKEQCCRAHESGTQSQEHERQAALQAFEQERARQQQVLQAEHQAALQVMQTERCGFWACPCISCVACVTAACCHNYALLCLLLFLHAHHVLCCLTAHERRLQTG